MKNYSDDDQKVRRRPEIEVEYFETYVEKFYFNHQTLFPVMHVTLLYTSPKIYTESVGCMSDSENYIFGIVCQYILVCDMTRNYVKWTHISGTILTNMSSFMGSKMMLLVNIYVFHPFYTDSCSYK